MRTAEIIYEDNHLIAINKPAGFLVQGDDTGDEPILDMMKDYIKERDQKPGNVFLAPNHRLDRPVSGSLLFSKTSKALSRVNQLFQKNEVEKVYYAILEGVPDPLQGQLEHYIAKNKKKNISFITQKGKFASKRCRLSYQVEKVINNRSLVRVQPESGRSHQIRVQLSSLGTPILGDIKYGGTYKMPDRSIGLHCYQLNFMHPIKLARVILQSEMPTYQVWQNFSNV